MATLYAFHILYAAATCSAYKQTDYWLMWSFTTRYIMTLVHNNNCKIVAILFTNFSTIYCVAFIRTVLGLLSIVSVFQFIALHRINCISSSGQFESSRFELGRAEPMLNETRKRQTRKCGDKWKTFLIEIFHFERCKFVYSSENLWKFETKWAHAHRHEYHHHQHMVCFSVHIFNSNRIFKSFPLTQCSLEWHASIGLDCIPFISMVH